MRAYEQRWKPVPKILLGGFLFGLTDCDNTTSRLKRQRDRGARPFPKHVLKGFNDFNNRRLSGRKRTRERDGLTDEDSLTVGKARRPSRLRTEHLYTLPWEKSMRSGKPCHAAQGVLIYVQTRGAGEGCKAPATGNEKNGLISSHSKVQGRNSFRK